MYTCVECLKQFDIIPEELAWYEQKFGSDNIPKRCKPCRKERKKENRHNRVKTLKERNRKILNELKEKEKELEEKNGISG